MGVLTWNCAGNAPSQSMDVSDIVLPENFFSQKKSGELSLYNEQSSEGQEEDSKQAPEFYIVGLQEMVDLEVIGSMMCSKDHERMGDWEYLIKRALDKRVQH